MKARPILIATAAGLLLPLAAANAGAMFDSGLNQVGAATDLERDAAPIAENHWRKVDDDNDKGDHDRKCDKSPSKDDDCDHGDKDHDKDHKGDKDDNR